MAVAIDSANAYRKKVGELLAAYKELLGIDTEYVAADIASGVVDADFPDITKLEFTDGVGSAQIIIAAIETQETNLYIMSDGSQR